MLCYCLKKKLFLGRRARREICVEWRLRGWAIGWREKSEPLHARMPFADAPGFLLGQTGTIRDFRAIHTGLSPVLLAVFDPLLALRYRVTV